MATDSIKLQEEEVQRILQIQQVTQNIINEYGNIELSKKALEERKEKVDEAYYNLLQTERTIAKELEEKYGKGSVNIQEGIFIPL
jgi:hypothetical protein